MLISIVEHIKTRSTGRLSAKGLEPLVDMLDSSSVLFGYDMDRGRNGRDPKFSAANMMTILLFMEIKCLTFSGLRERTEGRGGQKLLKNLGMPRGEDGRYMCPSDGWISEFRNHEYPYFQGAFEAELRKLVLDNAPPGAIKMTVDSTPLEGSRYSDWDYNPHYDIRMAKAHIIMISGIPFSWTFTDGNVGDNPQYLRMLDDAHLDRVRGAEVYADGGYDSFESYARTFVHTGSVMHGNPGVNAVIHTEACWDNIVRRYNRHHSECNFVPSSQAKPSFILRFLYNHGESEIVGKFLRNLDIMRGEKAHDADSLTRHVCETVHHAMKRWLRLDVRGLARRYAERRTSIRLAFCTMLALLFEPYTN